MIDFIIYTSSILFGFCSAFLMLIAEIFNLSYREISVYFNLYFQYGIILISCISILILSIKKYKLNVMSTVNTVLCIIYNIIVFNVGYKLYNRYLTISTDNAFFLCKDDLFNLSKYLNLNSDNLFYKEGWTEYFVVNIIIFIIIFISILFFNKIWKVLIKKFL